MNVNKNISPIVAIEIIIVFTLLAVVFNWWLWSQIYHLNAQTGIEESESFAEKGCKESGGAVRTEYCCKSAKSFSNMCFPGACGCAAGNSHEIKVCDCGAGKCFNGKTCVER